jgi:hypothetical protein
MSLRTVFLSWLIGIYSMLISISMLTRKQAALDVVTALIHNACPRNTALRQASISIPRFRSLSADQPRD